MRATQPVLALLVALAASATSAVDAAPLRVSRRASELRLVFLEGDADALVTGGATGDASIHVGRMSARCKDTPCSRTVTRKRFRMRVDGGGAVRFVRIRAFLQVGSAGQKYRIDGKLLSAVPTVIDPATPVRVAVAHTLEIEVSAAEPPGMLAETIQWEVEGVR